MLASHASFLAAATWSGLKVGGGGAAVTVVVVTVFVVSLVTLRATAVAASRSATVNMVHTAIQPGRRRGLGGAGCGAGEGGWGGA